MEREKYTFAHTQMEFRLLSWYKQAIKFATNSIELGSFDVERIRAGFRIKKKGKK